MPHGQRICEVIASIFYVRTWPAEYATGKLESECKKELINFPRHIQRLSHAPCGARGASDETA